VDWLKDGYGYIIILIRTTKYESNTILFIDETQGYFIVKLKEYIFQTWEQSYFNFVDH